MERHLFIEGADYEKSDWSRDDEERNWTEVRAMRGQKENKEEKEIKVVKKTKKLKSRNKKVEKTFVARLMKSFVLEIGSK